MSTSVDLMADLGEGYGPYRLADDNALLQVISSANIACGFHAGDPRIMDNTVSSCITHAVALGAHPGLPDRVGFGRRGMDLSWHEVMTDVLYQLGALDAFARRHGAPLRHLSPHGRLANLAAEEDAYAAGIIEAVLAFDERLVVASQEGLLLQRARKASLPVAVIGFGDRAYTDDGLLLDRREPGAVIHDPDEVSERVLRLVMTGTVLSRNGAEIEARCDTILLHGDTPGAVEIARRVRHDLEAAEVAIRPISGQT